MSQNSADDLRVRRTRRLLREALIDLTIEKGFAELTVQDIAERAMVNRATFYRHYEDKYDLVMATIAEVLAELQQPKDPHPIDGQAYLFDEPSPALVQLFAHLAEHAKFYRVMLGKDTFPQLENRIRGYVEELMRQRLAASGYERERTRIPFELCLSAMASTALGVIKWWLEHDMPYSARQMALWLPQINMLGLQYGLGLSQSSERPPG
jgi:AcrR family transcriptional regulator